MSQCDSSTSNTEASHPVSFVELMSLAHDPEDSELRAEVEGVLVLEDELEIMIQRVAQAIDSSKEVMQVLLHLHRSVKKMY